MWKQFRSISENRKNLCTWKYHVHGPQEVWRSVYKQKFAAGKSFLKFNVKNASVLSNTSVLFQQLVLKAGSTTVSSDKLN